MLFLGTCYAIHAYGIYYTANLGHFLSNYHTSTCTYQ